MKYEYLGNTPTSQKARKHAKWCKKKAIRLNSKRVVSAAKNGKDHLGLIIKNPMRGYVW